MTHARPPFAVLEAGVPVGGLLPADDRPQLHLGPPHGNPERLPLGTRAAGLAWLCCRGRAGLAQWWAGRAGPLGGSDAPARTRLGWRSRPQPAAAGQRQPRPADHAAADPPARCRLADESAQRRAAVAAHTVSGGSGAGHAGDRTAAALQPRPVPHAVAHRHQRHHPRPVHPAFVRGPLPHADRAVESVARAGKCLARRPVVGSPRPTHHRPA